MNLVKTSIYLWAVVCSLCFSACNGVIYKYDNVLLKNLVLKYRSVYMFSPNDAPALNKKNPNSFISFDLTFTLDADNIDLENNFVEVHIYKSGTGSKRVASTIDQSYCCSPDQAPANLNCRAPNALVVAEGLDNIVDEIVVVDFADGYEDEDGRIVVEKRFTYQVEEKDLYSLMFSYCQQNAAVVSISGSVSWRNPFGFLHGELYGFLPFYLHLSLAYLFCGMVWAYLCAKNWRDLLMVQNCITAVLVLGMIEVNLRYSDFHSLNETGVRNSGLLMAAVLFAVIKKCVSRMLVLVVSLGYGVVKPHLGPEGTKVALLGAVYFVVATLHHLVDSVSTTNQQSMAVSKFFFLVPVAVVDTIFYFWIFRALRTTIVQLETRGQDTKLSLYLKFRRLLVASIVISILWAVYYALENLMIYNAMEWESVYFMESFWDCLYLAILISIMYLWRPNQNSQRYAYNVVKTWDNEDAEEYDNGLEDSVGDFSIGKAPKQTDNLIEGDVPQAKNA
mmetsp:Transcript_8921/g.10679  ORF Transcript_8921/g.10679 Transcript_8921/m.10679 type:complete len:505 (+) Transcript_8921:217-1731(+)